MRKSEGCSLAAVLHGGGGGGRRHKEQHQLKFSSCEQGFFLALVWSGMAPAQRNGFAWAEADFGGWAVQSSPVQSRCKTRFIHLRGRDSFQSHGMNLTGISKGEQASACFPVQGHSVATGALMVSSLSCITDLLLAESYADTRGNPLELNNTSVGSLSTCRVQTIRQDLGSKLVQSSFWKHVRVYGQTNVPAQKLQFP